MAVKNNAGSGTFAVLYCNIFRTPSFRKSLKFLGTSIAFLDPQTVQLPSFTYHVHSSVLPAREANTRSGAVLERPANDS